MRASVELCHSPPRRFSQPVVHNQESPLVSCASCECASCLYSTQALSDADSVYRTYIYAYTANESRAFVRDPTDFNDKSRRKGDLTVTGLFDEGKTILDIGITHPTIDSSINTLSSEERAAGANRYANNKGRRAPSTPRT